MIIGRKNFRLIRTILDAFCILISFLGAAAIAQPWQILTGRTYMFLLPVLLSVTWYFSANLTGYYEDFTSRFYPYQALTILKNVMVLAGTSIVFIFLIKEDLYTRNFVVVFSLLLALR